MRPAHQVMRMVPMSCGNGKAGYKPTPYDVMPVCAAVRRELSTENRL